MDARERERGRGLGPNEPPGLRGEKGPLNTEKDWKHAIGVSRREKEEGIISRRGNHRHVAATRKAEEDAKVVAAAAVTAKGEERSPKGPVEAVFQT